MKINNEKTVILLTIDISLSFTELRQYIYLQRFCIYLYIYIYIYIYIYLSVICLSIRLVENNYFEFFVKAQ